MTRSLATAVLWAVSSLFSLTDADDGVLDMDDAGDPICELADSSYSSGRSERRGLLAEASAICGETIDHAWVAELPDQRRVAVAVRGLGHVAYVSLATGVGSRDSLDAASSLLSRALSHCRELGMLKVILHSERSDNEPLIRVVESRGYRYCRIRQLDGGNAIEFYADLYRPESDRSRAA